MQNWNQTAYRARQYNTIHTFIEHITYYALVSLTINRIYYSEFEQMHCTMLSLARMNHFQNVDIVKLRKSEPHIIRWRDDKAKTESKGINAEAQTPIHTASHSSIQRRRFNFLLFNSIVRGLFLLVSSTSSLSVYRLRTVVFVNYIEQLFSCGFISVIYTLVFPFHLILCQAKK